MGFGYTTILLSGKGGMEIEPGRGWREEGEVRRKKGLALSQQLALCRPLIGGVDNLPAPLFLSSFYFLFGAQNLAVMKAAAGTEWDKFVPTPLFLSHRNFNTRSLLPPPSNLPTLFRPPFLSSLL